MARQKRFASVIIAAIIALAILFSTIFVVVNAEHDCHGDDCAICHQIEVCLSHFQNYSPKPSDSAVLLNMLFILVLLIGTISTPNNSITLVDLKVKLTD